MRDDKDREKRMLDDAGRMLNLPSRAAVRALAEKVDSLVWLDQRPDPHRPELMDIMVIRMPHGGCPRPEGRYTGGLAMRNRLVRFATMFLCGFVEEGTGDKYLAKRLRRLHDAMPMESPGPFPDSTMMKKGR